MHNQRVKSQPDFNFMREQIARVLATKDDELLPLNKEQLKAKRDAAEQWQLDAENRRRLAKGEKPISKLSEIDDELQKDKSGRPITTESEAILEESARILLDLATLEQSFKTASNQ